MSLSRAMTTALVLLLAVGLLSCGNPLEEETYHRPVGEGPWVLVDLYHTRKQNPEDYHLYKGNYRYQGVFGFRRAFNHLEDNDYKWTSIRTLPLSRQRLEGFDVLFINLVDDRRPPFSDDEIEAVTDFVRGGGGLFVIVDHTNVYSHAARINPLIEPMGIEALYHTATDKPPEYSVAGRAWIMAFDMADHAVTDGVEMVSMQTGGALETDHGVAFTSEHSFADLWNPDEPTGHYGNWQHDGDEEVEPRGPLPIVAAREFGQGRVVVAADQNMFGDAWLHFGHNFELLMNSIEWLAQQTPDVPLRERSLEGTSIGLDLEGTDFGVGRKGAPGYYNFFVHLNRDTDVSASATMGVDLRKDVQWFLSPSEVYDEEQLDQIRAYLEGGGQVMVTMSPNEPRDGTMSLLEALAPELTVTSGEGLVLSPNAMTDGMFPKVRGRLALKSDYIDIDGLSLGARSIGRDDEAAYDYFRDTRSAWGRAFITTERGTDIARIGRVGRGTLVVFLQDEFWRNHTLGESEVDPPTSYNRDAITLIYRVLEHVKTRDETATARQETHP
jgi:hypothetical protein